MPIISHWIFYSFTFYSLVESTASLTFYAV